MEAMNPDQHPLPLAADLNVEATVVAIPDGPSVAIIQLRATTANGDTHGFAIPADVAAQLTTMLRTAGRRARRNKAMHDAGKLEED